MPSLITKYRKIGEGIPTIETSANIGQSRPFPPKGYSVLNISPLVFVDTGSRGYRTSRICQRKCDFIRQMTIPLWVKCSKQMTMK